MPTEAEKEGQPVYPFPILLDRMVRAVEKVRIRLLRTAKALDDAGIPYAVIGGNAVAAWVSRIDEAAVRNTQDVDILIQRSDLESVKQVLESVGFIFRRSAGIDFFLDGPDSKFRDAVHLLMSGEKVREEYVTPAPSVFDSERTQDFQVISLPSLVEMKLNSYRRKDQTHLMDMIEVGLIDDTWPAKFPALLAERLQTLIDDPNG